jgi:4-hydroxy-3-methylbut-2-enyl diphosphate reductase
MSDWIDIESDPAHIKRERERARELRKSAWWQQQCQPGICHYCKMKVGAKALTMDHVVPVVRGGTSTKGNVVPACKACNNKKKYITPAEQILQTLEAETPSLFTPDEMISDASDEEAGSSIRSLFIAQPHGFCSGVARAIQMAEKTLQQKADGEVIYCLNEIVHNQHVVSRLSEQGMVFVTRVDVVPEGSKLLFSAHGVAPSVRELALARHLTVIDATCPFVAKVHDEVKRFSSMGIDIVCIGHRKHEEVIGVVGEAPERVRVVENAEEVAQLDLPEDSPVAVVTQTTLGEAQVEGVMAALRARFPRMISPPHADICYATRDRQRAVRELAQMCDGVAVLGSANSSNSQRLVETARAAGAQAVLISELSQLTQHDWSRYQTLGVTSGASTPEDFLEEAVSLLEQQGFSVV